MLRNGLFRPLRGRADRNDQDSEKRLSGVGAWNNFLSSCAVL
ncbi:hypothetical protein EBME_0080 [bacterium endosymbiont of Mortierella elongata FMR23-6]|nr:hypothetical protein EBME_0080 [bacterium endosymbiont of Mortierella elongata FMR23-6]